MKESISANIHERDLAYIDLCGCLWIEERFDRVPQEPESRTSIDDEHTVQSLQEYSSTPVRTL